MAEEDEKRAPLRIEGIVARAGVPDQYGTVWSQEAIGQIARALADGTMTLAPELRHVTTRPSDDGLIVSAEVLALNIVRKGRPT